VRLAATFDHPLSEWYARPGGPWDVSTLDTLTAEGGGTVVDGELVLDGAQVHAAARALAGGLQEHGVGRGDVVSWQLPNWHEAILLYRACWLVGAIAAPLQHKLGVADLAPVLELLEPTLTFSASDLAISQVSDPVIVRDGSGAFDALSADFVDAPVAPTGADIAVAAMTSGSTGNAKAVLLSHQALQYKVGIQQSVQGLRPSDVLLTAAPLSHVSGLLNGVLLSGAAGMKIVLMEVWDPDRALDLIEQHGVTYMGGPAVFLTSLTESTAFDPTRVASLRVCSMGGSTMTPAALARLAERLGCVVKRTYGMTEAPSITTTHDRDPPARGRETDGRVVGEAEVVIVDATDGTRLPAGERGEILLRGPEMFSGYAVESQTDDAITVDGWLRTGDLGVIDDEGWLRVVGRIKELIIRGGENIATAEVEGLVEAHPLVSQAVAVGYPDAILGERVAGVVVADAAFDLDTCRQWFADAGVAKFKTPEAIVHVDEMPMTPTGKPDRLALKTHVAKLMSEGSSSQWI
jgi:cyclohexanecarboxylate-CoA ligase